MGTNVHACGRTCVSVCIHVCVCMHACVHACVRECVCWSCWYVHTDGYQWCQVNCCAADADRQSVLPYDSWCQ